MGSKVCIFSGTKNNFGGTKINFSGTKNNISGTKINFSRTKINFSKTKINFSRTKIIFSATNIIFSGTKIIKIIQTFEPNGTPYTFPYKSIYSIKPTAFTWLSLKVRYTFLRLYGEKITEL